jgi:hypothetical protein
MPAAQRRGVPREYRRRVQRQALSVDIVVMEESNLIEVTDYPGGRGHRDSRRQVADQPLTESWVSAHSRS